MKTYKRRDSATRILRKLGVDPDNYALFIAKNKDGTFSINFENAKRSVSQMVLEKRGRRSISRDCQELIMQGLSNKDAFAKLQEMYGTERMPDHKKWYPGWNRAKLRRLGALPPILDGEAQARNPHADRTEHRFEEE